MAETCMEGCKFFNKKYVNVAIKEKGEEKQTKMQLDGRGYRKSKKDWCQRYQEQKTRDRKVQKKISESVKE